MLIMVITGCSGGGSDSISEPSSSAKAITAFTLNGVVGTINETDKTIAVTIPVGTDVTALVATFTTTGASVKVGSTVQISETTAHNFTSPVVYKVIAADATTWVGMWLSGVGIGKRIILMERCLIPVLEGGRLRARTASYAALIETTTRLFYRLLFMPAITRISSITITGFGLSANEFCRK